MTLHFKHDTLILDASCVINLYASRKMVEILSAVPADITIAAYVADKEALQIRGSVENEDIDLQPMIADGLITIVTPETESETETALSIAAAIRGQGEAETGAIAIHRRWTIALDDRRARNYIAEISSDLQMVYSLELVKHWVDSQSASKSEIQSALQNIRTGGNYIPRRSNPLHRWWHESI